MCTGVLCGLLFIIEEDNILHFTFYLGIRCSKLIISVTKMEAPIKCFHYKTIQIEIYSKSCTEWEHDLLLCTFMLKRQKLNLIVCTALNPGLGYVKSIYVEQQCSLATEHSAQTIVDHQALASEHTTS